MSEKKILFLLLIISTISLFLIAGCLPKKECETSDDCVKKECRTVQCVEEKCVYNIIPNCCGNMRCEKAVGENNCTCANDCGECKGRETFKEKDSNREKETEYLSYVCIYQECVLDSKRETKSFFTEKILEYFKLGINSNFEQPFDVFKSSFKVKVDLKEAHDKLVLPINFTKIIVLDKQNKVLGEKEIHGRLEKVGDSFEEELYLLGATDVLEETKYATLKIEYYYSVLEKTGRDEEGNPIYTPTSPSWRSIEYQSSDKLVFVNPRAKR